MNMDQMAPMSSTGPAVGRSYLSAIKSSNKETGHFILDVERLDFSRTSTSVVYKLQKLCGPQQKFCPPSLLEVSSSP